MSIADTKNDILNAHIYIARTIMQANAIEGIVDAYIAEYYTRCPAADYREPYLKFIYDVLSDRGVTFNAKVDILFKIFKRINATYATNKNREVYKNWLRIRNKFAHGKYIGDDQEGKLFYSGEYYNVKSLANDFMILQQEINIHLDIYKELRGVYFNHIPTKNWEKKK